MMKSALIFIAVYCCVIATIAVSLENGLARTPPMGWLAWERFVCETNCDKYPNSCISETLFKQQADKLIEDGYAKLGYKYVNIDDCWSEKQRKDGLLVVDKKRFPNGMRALSDYMHKRDLKLGLYGDCGTATCQLFPGQLNKSDSLENNYFEVDANSFSNWAIDSFKFDACNVDVVKSHSICPLMSESLNKTGRPILFSCSWPAYENEVKIDTDFNLVASRCNLWRAFGDIEDSWQSVIDTIDWFVKKQDIIVKYHGPGQWFDADQLVIGDFGLSDNEEQAHMAVWSIWSVPLYMSNDLRTISKSSREILKNEWLIEVNQDKHGVFGLMIDRTRDVQVFLKPIEPIKLGCPSYALVYLNRATLGDSKYISFKISTLIQKLHLKLASIDEDRFGKWSNCSLRSGDSFKANDLIDQNTILDIKLEYKSILELRVDPSSARMIKLTRY